MSLTITPKIEDARVAKRASQRVSKFLASHNDPCVELRLSSGKSFAVPEIAIQVLQNVLASMAQGRSLTVYPEDAELTTQKAADLLNVSRPYLVRLLEDGMIPYSKVGTHRRVRFADLRSYKLKSMEQREDALQELADQTQDLVLGY